MKNLTIVSSNHKSISFIASDTDTLSQILRNEDVEAFFDADGETIEESLIQCGAAELESDALRNMALKTTPDDGDTVVIDLEAEGDDADDDEAENVGTSTGTAVSGIVTIYAAGGLKIDIDITPGMTVTEAAYNETVQLRSRQTMAQLTNCPISVNGVPLTASAASARPVNPGDIITLSPAMNAGTKGNN